MSAIWRGLSSNCAGLVYRPSSLRLDEPQSYRSHLIKAEGRGCSAISSGQDNMSTGFGAVGVWKRTAEEYQAAARLMTWIAAGLFVMLVLLAAFAFSAQASFQ